MNNEQQTIDLNDIVAIKLTPAGLEQVRNYFLTVYGDLGYGMYQHFVDTSVFGRVMTSSVMEFMLIFGNGLLSNQYFEGSEFNVVDTSFKEARKRREAKDAEIEAVLQQAAL
ncbi:MAG: hypothetical protein IJA23_05245 [Clostridia bacterium]|nr:hypothetical protein [Clostridia bacterium]